MSSLGKEKTDFGIIYIHSLLSKSHLKYTNNPTVEVQSIKYQL